MRPLEVYLNDILLGRLTEVPGATAFEYSQEAIETLHFEPSPITAPLKPGVQVFRDRDFDLLPPMVADSLPGSFAARTMDPTLVQGSVLKLLSLVGDSGIGALRFRPDRAIPESEPVYLAEAVEKVRQETTDSGDPTRLRVLTGSIGGSFPKIVLSKDVHGRLWTVSAKTFNPGFSQWIVKLATPRNERHNLDNFPEIEAAYFHMARDCGLRVPRVELWKTTNRFGQTECHLAIERFDIHGCHRIHTQTFSAISGVAARSPASVDYRDMVSRCRKHIADMREVEELFCRAVFNVAGNNLDDHTENHSWQVIDGAWQLSPAYDFAFIDSDGDRNLRAMSVMGASSAIGRKSLMRLADIAGISDRRAAGHIERICAIVKKSEDYLQKTGCPGAAISRIASITANNVSKLR